MFIWPQKWQHVICFMAFRKHCCEIMQPNKGNNLICLSKKRNCSISSVHFENVIVPKNYIISLHITSKRERQKFSSTSFFFALSICRIITERNPLIIIALRHKCTKIEALKILFLRSYVPNTFHKKVNVAIILCLVTHLCLIFLANSQPTNH